MINVSNPNLLSSACLQSYIYDSIENPLDNLKAFFDYQDLQSHLQFLKQWRNLVTSNGYFEINTINNPLFNHKMICNLINAAWLLNQEDEQFGVVKGLSSKEQEKYLNHECLQLRVYAKHLNVSELIDPYLGIKSCYELFALQEYHQHLYDWLNKSLSPNVIIADTTLVNKVYKNLRKLIECCWLIYVRNFNKNLNQKEETLPVEKDQLVMTSIDEIIPENILTEFKRFLNVVPASRLNRGLRKMLIDFLFYNIDGLPVDFEDLLSDFYWLTDLLDEIQGKEISPKFSKY